MKESKKEGLSGFKINQTNITRRNFFRIIYAGMMWQSCTKDAPAEIRKPEILFPGQGDILEAGQPVTIQWNAQDAKFVDLYISMDRGISWNIVTKGRKASENFTQWLTPSTNNPEVLLKISDSNDPSLENKSGFFEILQSARIPVSQYPGLSVINETVVIKPIYFDDFSVRYLGNQSFSILSIKCTHNGCPVEWNAGRFECYCHGSLFKDTGCVIQGPAKENLTSYINRYDKNSDTLIVFRKSNPVIC